MRWRASTTARVTAGVVTTGLLAVAGLSGCSLGAGDDDAASPTPSGSGAPEQSEVVLMTHGSFALPKKLMRQFTEETGYTVEVRKSGDAGQLASKLTLSAGNPEGDVTFGIDNTFLSRVQDAGAVDGDMTAIDKASVCVNVDTTWFRKRGIPAPRTLDDLTEPAYEDLLAVPGATTSSPGLAFLLATIAEKGDGWEAYWRDLMDNGATVVDGWDQAYYVEFTQGGGQGTRPIVVSYDSSPAFTVHGGRTTTTALLDTCFRQVEYAGVLEGADNPEGGKAFVDFLRSPEVQEALPTSMYVYPAVPGTPLPKDWARFARQPEHTLDVPPADIEANREEWLQQWSDIVSQ